MQDWTVHDFGVMEVGERFNSKGIYNILIPSLILGAGRRLEKPLGLGVWFLQLRPPCCVL